MKKEDKLEQFENTEEEMTVSLSLDDGREVECAIVTILTVNSKDYIALLPLDEEKNGNPEGDVWLYGYSEDPDDPNKEPEIIYIDDDDEYEAVRDAYDEWLDDKEFDEII